MNNRIGQWAAAAMLAAAVVSPSRAQTGTATISGRITDRQSQQPIVGAQVRVTGTARGAMSDDQGVYRIAGVPAGSVQLAVQRIGYAPASRLVPAAAGASVTADFALSAGTVTLDQVTVTATGQSERRRESGVSTALLDSSMINKATVSTLADVLSSRAPGVVVQQSSGQTGTGSRIRVRGSNSISLSNDPLVIVDGVRFDNNSTGPASATGTPIGTGGQVPSRFNDLNPEEIESIEIIKGPAAASLYGTAAANGVIQITTKKGRSGKTRWDAFLELGNLHDVNDYPVNYRSFGHNAAGGLVTNCSLYSRTSTSATHCVAVDSTIDNSPLDAANALQEGNRRLAGLSAAGGSDAATYFLSAEYQKEQNVIPVNAQQRLNIRTNLRGQLTRTLDAQVNLGYVNSDLRRPQNDNNVLGVVSAALLGKAADCGPGGLAAQHPTLCGGDTTSRGYYNGQPPQAVYNINSRQQVQRFTGGITSNFTPLSWLAFNGTLGADVNHQNDNETLQPGIVDFAQATLDGYRQVSRGVSSDYTASLNGTATYDASPTLRFISTLGSQYTDVYYTRTDAYGQRLLAGTNSLSGTNALFTIAEVTNDIRTLGFIGREQLAWRDRVFVTAGLRSDKNSAFGVNFARIFYPSVSASWVVSDESFFPKIDAISSLRLRSAFGAAGQNPGYLASELYFQPVAVTVGGVDFPGFTVGSAGNPDLRPEKSTEVEGGLDLGLFGDRVNLEYTHYNKITKDALVDVNLAPSLGSSPTRFQNLGQVRNYGDELLLRAALLDMRSVKLDVTVNGAWNANHLDDLGVDALGNPLPDITAGFNSTQIIRAGLPLGAYYQQPLVSYADANGDGLIGCAAGLGSPSCEIVVGDEPTYLGSPFPSSEISFTPALSLGRFARMTATFDHRGGQKLFNLTAYYRNTAIQNGAPAQLPSADNLAAQAAAQAGAQGTFAGFIENASFTKLREVALSLTLPQRFATRAGAGSATLTLAGRNLKTWTNYSGLDPELNAGAQANYSTADFLTAPQVRYFTARLALSF